MTEYVGEAHTDQRYTPLLAQAMQRHAMMSAVEKFAEGEKPYLSAGEGGTIYIAMQCLHTPGEANIPDTYDVTATLTDVTATYTTPREETKRRHWWRRGCKR